MSMIYICMRSCLYVCMYKICLSVCLCFCKIHLPQLKNEKKKENDNSKAPNIKKNFVLDLFHTPFLTRNKNDKQWQTHRTRNITTTTQTKTTKYLAIWFSQQQHDTFELNWRKNIERKFATSTQRKEQLYAFPSLPPSFSHIYFFLFSFVFLFAAVSSVLFCFHELSLSFRNKNMVDSKLKNDNVLNIIIIIP